MYRLGEASGGGRVVRVCWIYVTERAFIIAQVLLSKLGIFLSGYEVLMLASRVCVPTLELLSRMAHLRVDECPLCCEDFSIQDKNFKPCQCGYQVDLFFRVSIVTSFTDVCIFCLASDLHVVLASHQERLEWALSELPITVSDS